MKAYIVTEGEVDSGLLQKLLPPEHLQNVIFVPAGDVSSATSLARSILARRRCPVALVLDANTTNSQVIKERNQILTDSLNSVSSNTPSKVFLIAPEIEILFFGDREVLQEMLGCEVSDEIWFTAKFIPKETLKKLLKQKDIDSFLDNQTENLSTLQNAHFLKDIDDFLVSVSPS